MELIIYVFLIVIINIATSFCSVTNDITNLFKYLQIDIPANNDVACNMNGIICSPDKLFITHLNIEELSGTKETKKLSTKQLPNSKQITPSKPKGIPEKLKEATKRIPEKAKKTKEKVKTKTKEKRPNKSVEKSVTKTKSKEKKPTPIKIPEFLEHNPLNPSENLNNNGETKPELINTNDKKINENVEGENFKFGFNKNVYFKFKRATENDNSIVVDNLFNKNYGLDKSTYNPKNEVLKISKKIDLSNFPILTKLVSLTINGNVFNGNTIPPRIFELPNLQYLHFANTNLKEITKSINPQSPIKIINIEGNAQILNEFPIQFTNLQNLTELYLQNNKFDCVLPQELSSFPSLQILSLSSNSMKGEVIIPESLKYLNINNNQFSSLRSTLNTNNLEVFFGSDNKFENNIFDNLSLYKNLMLIDLSSNPGINSIPLTIANFENLQVLNLKNESLTELPPNLFKLSNLKGLDISGNPLSNVKFINFNNNVIEQCVLPDSNIDCYQPNTCANIDNTKFRNCTQEEIESILNSQTNVGEDLNKSIDNNDDSNTSDFSSYRIPILSGVVFILFVVVLSLSYMIYRSKNETNSSQSSGSDIYSNTNTSPYQQSMKSPDIGTTKNSSLSRSPLFSSNYVPPKSPENKFKV